MQHRGTTAVTVIHDLPNTRFYEGMRNGHGMRTGHRLVAYLVEQPDGTTTIVRECCGD